MAHSLPLPHLELCAIRHLFSEFKRHSLESIKNDPKTAIVPTSVAAVCMVVYRTLSLLEKDWVKPWMEYMQRLDTEAQAMFANGVRSEKYSKQAMVMGSQVFRDWALKNSHLYTADV